MFILDHVTVTILIAVIGWVITHILTLKAQRKKFLDDINNNARIEISKAIRDYQGWLSASETYFKVLEFKLRRIQIDGPMDWESDYKTFQEKVLIDSPNYWSWLLEEYRILFPETARIRTILSRRDFEIHEAIRWFYIEFWRRPQDPEQLTHNRIIIFNQLQGWLDYITDQLCLLIDLQIYLQNKVLNEITESHVPSRKPPNVSSPRIIMGPNSELIIVDGKGNEVEHSKQPFSSADIWQYPFDDLDFRY